MENKRNKAISEMIQILEYVYKYGNKDMVEDYLNSQAEGWPYDEGESCGATCLCFSCIQNAAQYIIDKNQ